MIKELKYLFYIAVIFIFLFFTIKFYHSDSNIKNSFRTINSYKSILNESTENLIVLNSDTDNIIEYIDDNKNPKKKKFYFWNLLNDNE